MRLFLDTNVVMDFMECRTPFVYDAVRIIRMGYEGVHQLFASDLTFANVAYLSRKSMSSNQLYEQLSVLRTYLHVAGIGEQVVDEALRLRHKDFEDALQYFAAKQIAADCIITRNKKDFLFPDIQVWTPEEFLKTVE